MIATEAQKNTPARGKGGGRMLSYKINLKPAEEEVRIEEVLDGNERIAHILQQPFPSTDPKGKIADEDYEALQGL